MAKTYQLKEAGIHRDFANLRTEIQIFGGGYGNGKTSAAVVLKILTIAEAYPGCSILAARSTYPKLNDTLRKTFIEFCPPEWIESFPMSKNSENTCTLRNGSKINFRYIAQRTSTEDGGSTSNLLSATYDLAVIDQIEDPEITHKDFLDILGRMRGSAIYRGNDPTMPRTGPGWIIATTNPTRNWVYKQLVEPLHKYKEKGIISDNLLLVRDKDTGKPTLTDGKPELLVGLVEGSTYENAHVLDEKFIRRLESIYVGQMKDRFLKGEWAAYEGLVYPDYSYNTHVIRHDRLMMYMRDIMREGYRLNWYEGYDYGLQAPSVYLLAFSDHLGNVFVVDYFYQPEAPIDWQAREITSIRHRYGVPRAAIMGDPSIMRRVAVGGKTVGKSIAEMFWDEDKSIHFDRGNNDIVNGITKVRSYLQPHAYHSHPITGETGSPHIYFSDRIKELDEEMQTYYWNTAVTGEREDKPVDRNDHSLDALKYLLSYAPEPATFIQDRSKIELYKTTWLEKEPEAYHGY